VLEATADPDGQGLLLRGLEHQPESLAALSAADRGLALALEGSLRLARLAVAAADALREHPDPVVRRAAASLAARAHPLLAAAEASA
jgi:hypothetical protein